MNPLHAPPSPDPIGGRHDEFKDTLYWATTETKMRKERAQELGVDPALNIASTTDREQRAKGCLWAAFMAGFAAAGGKTTF
jgi:hypothetical protein